MQQQQQQHRSQSAKPHSLLLLLPRRRCHRGLITRLVFHQTSGLLAAAVSTCRRVRLLGSASARSALWRLLLTMLGLKATMSGECDSVQQLQRLLFIDTRVLMLLFWHTNEGSAVPAMLHTRMELCGINTLITAVGWVGVHQQDVPRGGLC
jgi:hypothetical protein